MNDMLEFCTGLLSAVASWLGTSPIIYITGFLLALIAVKIIKTIMS